jgi:hypothetical protein
MLALRRLLSVTNTGVVAIASCSSSSSGAGDTTAAAAAADTGAAAGGTWAITTHFQSAPAVDCMVSVGGGGEKEPLCYMPGTRQAHAVAAVQVCVITQQWVTLLPLVMTHRRDGVGHEGCWYPHLAPLCHAVLLLLKPNHVLLAAAAAATAAAAAVVCCLLLVLMAVAGPRRWTPAVATW